MIKAHSHYLLLNSSKFLIKHITSVFSMITQWYMWTQSMLHVFHETKITAIQIIWQNSASHRFPYSLSFDISLSAHCFLFKMILNILKSKHLLWKLQKKAKFQLGTRMLNCLCARIIPNLNHSHFHNSILLFTLCKSSEKNMLSMNLEVLKMQV